MDQKKKLKCQRILKLKLSRIIEKFWNDTKKKMIHYQTYRN